MKVLKNQYFEIELHESSARNAFSLRQVFPCLYLSYAKKNSCVIMFLSIPDPIGKNRQSLISHFIWDHPFSVYAKFPENLTFFTPLDTHTYVWVSGVVFLKILRSREMDNWVNPYA